MSAARAVVVIGDEKGKVGVGTATAKEVVEAVQKAVSDAKKHLIQVRTWTTAARHHMRHFQPLVTGYSMRSRHRCRPLLGVCSIIRSCNKPASSSQQQRHHPYTALQQQACAWDAGV